MLLKFGKKIRIIICSKTCSSVNTIDEIRIFFVTFFTILETNIYREKKADMKNSDEIIQETPIFLQKQRLEHLPCNGC